MKKLIFTAILLLSMVLPAYAVTVSINATIEVMNAPSHSQWGIECGTSTGVYTTIVKSFVLNNTGTTTIGVDNIFSESGSYFCRTRFVIIRGRSTIVQGPFSVEIPVIITVPPLVVPILTIVP
jgi:hypothetical protein